MRIGTVGTNFIVTWAIEAARENGHEIAACYSRSEETAKAFALSQGVEKTYTDREEFLSDESLDFIYVASPNSLHHSWALDALRHGRNVICEKPFVSAAWELEELIAAAKEKGLFLFEAITVEHLPNFRLMKEKLPLIGQPRLAQFNFSQYSSRYDAYLRGENPNIFNPDFSGGALMDIGYYNVRAAMGLFGIPQEVRYTCSRGPNGADTSGVLVAKYPGLVCSLAACKDSVSPNFVLVQGEEGYIHSASVSSTLADGFTLRTKELEQHFGEQDKRNVLTYEMKRFGQFFEEKNHAAADELLGRSLDAAGIMDRARASAGIVFAADKKEGADA